MPGSGEAREDNSTQIPRYRVRPLLLAAKQSDRGVNSGAVGQGRCNVSRCVLPVLCVPNPASEQSNLSVFETKKRRKKRKKKPMDAAQEDILTSGIANLCRFGSSSS